MKYKVTHTTIYNYTEAVPICHNEVHLTPRDHRRQTCLAHRLRIRPEPARIDTRVDAFGNHAGWFSIQEGHERLAVTAHSQVQVAEPEVPDPASTPPWEEIRDRFALGQPPWWLEARQFVYESPHVPIADELRAYAQPSFPAGRPWLAGVLDLTQRINQRIQVRTGGDDDQHARRKSAQRPPRRVPGFRPPADRLPAVARLAGPLCQRLFADAAPPRAAAAGRGGCLARLGLGLLPGGRLDRFRPDQQPDSVHAAHHAGLGPRLQRRLPDQGRARRRRPTPDARRRGCRAAGG